MFILKKKNFKIYIGILRICEEVKMEEIICFK